MKTTALFSLLLSAAGMLSAANVTVMYGDNDGFGQGATTIADITISNPDSFTGTDVRLIGDGFVGSGFPAFIPTGSVPFSISGTITSATLTLSMAAFGTTVGALDGPSSIVINGLAVSSSFLDSFLEFGDYNDPNVETKSFALPVDFFALLAGGSFDLTGTHISESSGAGSFMVDYLQLDIVTDASEAPEPSTFALGAAALAAMGFARKRLA